MHAMIEPIMALVFIIAPFVLDYDDSTAKTLSIVLGVVLLVVGMTTRWRWSLVKLIPLSMHFAGDLAIGVIAIAAPFVLGFSDDTAATVVFVVLGIGEVGAALGTAWRAEDGRVHTAAGPTGTAPLSG
jgi:SPW repeat